MSTDINTTPHRRYNILTGEWILVSPHRTKRPWQGKTEKQTTEKRETYDPTCYLCPGNTRNSGKTNPDYKKPFSFENDFPSLLPENPSEAYEQDLLKAEPESGICKVVCFSPDHSLTLPIMRVEDIAEVVKLWKREYAELGAQENINYVQIFENKGDIMGCSNPHPHGQIWSQKSIPTEVQKKSTHLKAHWEKTNRSLLADYLKQELELKERILEETEHFVALIPYWAVWPFEALIIPKNHYQHIGQLNEVEERDFAKIIKKLTIKYLPLIHIS